VAEHQEQFTHGHLLVIGGHEDREHDKDILHRFVELSGGGPIVVMTSASKNPQAMWETYDKAFADLGVRHRCHINVESRADANHPATLEKVRCARGIFMTGGDQKRLMANVGGTELDQSMHEAFKVHGACVAGTSAGASAMSGHMLASGETDVAAKGTISLGAGFGFVEKVVIDQHFNERHRLGRLLTVVAQNPYLQGIGIDEDTALLIQRGVGIEVLGQGAVTIIDGHDMQSDVAEVREDDIPELIDVRLHLLPAGRRYQLDGAHALPGPLTEFLKNMTKRTPLS
jgi:cyanophycinase